MPDVGTVANAVLHGFADGPFNHLSVHRGGPEWCIRAVQGRPGRLRLGDGRNARRSDQGPGLVPRPQEISNHPEVIRGLGVIAINKALEADIYGNVNSMHVNGSQMMNGIGSSEDFARNGYLSIFVTKSIAKGGTLAKIVPMVTHVDRTEHDVDVIVTEQGLADFRGLAPRERAKVTVENCAHPAYRELLRDYVAAANRRGGHTPHLLEQAFDWHVRQMATGSMFDAEVPKAGDQVARCAPCHLRPSAGRHSGRPAPERVYRGNGRGAPKARSPQARPHGRW